MNSIEKKFRYFMKMCLFILHNLHVPVFFTIDHLWRQGMIVGPKESDPLQKLLSIFLVMKMMMMISWMILKFQVTNLQAILSLAIDNLI